MWTARCSAAVLVCIGLSSLAPSSAAQDGPASSADEQARWAFREGAQAFENGSYRVALERFQSAYDLSGRPELLFNIGLAHDRLREDARALESFERYLAEVPGAANRAEVEGRVAELRRVARERERSQNETAEGSIFEQWWLWAIAGALVVGGVVAVLVLTNDTVQDPLPGSTGGVSSVLVSW